MTREELKERIHTIIDNEKLDDRLKKVVIMILVDQYIINCEKDLLNEIHRVLNYD